MTDAAAQQMLAALNALYHQDGTDIKEQASKFLEQWQSSVEAWSISDALLHNPATSMEAQYFCAQTLRTKVQRDFEDLPINAVDSLRDSLMTLLLQYAKGPPPVRTQLCLALVALTVHVPAERWALPPGTPVPDSINGGGAVTWFAVNLQRAPPETSLPCLLELLTVLPQEVNSMKYAVRPERRRQHAMELRAATGAAINILTECLAVPQAKRPAILEAFGGWLRLSEGAALGPDGTRVATHPLVLSCLEGLKSGDDLFHAACDGVVELVWCTVDQSNGQLQPAMMPLIQTLVPAVMALRSRFAVASRRATEEIEDDVVNSHRHPAAPSTDDFDDDEHTAKGMARMFAEIGEAYVHLIATAAQQVQEPVEALLEVAAHPEPSLASMSFNFWHKLSKSLTSGWGPRAMSDSRASSGSLMDVALQEPPGGPEAANEMVRRRQFFMPAFERLAQVVRGKVKYPTKSSGWSKEQFADFRRHRYEIADSLEDCAGVLGFSRCLTILVEPLVQLSAAQAAGRPFDWRTAEAALFCVRSIAPHSYDEPPGQPAQLQQLLSALPTLPRQHTLLLSCSCYTAARYSGWLASYLSVSQAQGIPNGTQGGEQLLTSLLQLALSCVDVPDASAGACSAILDLCCHCSRFMAPCIPSLMQLYTRIQSAGGVASSLGNAAKAGIQVSEEDVQMVMQAICVAVSKSLPPDQLQQAGSSLLQPVLIAVQAAAQQLPAIPQQPPAAGSTSSPLFSQHPALCPLLDRLATLFAHFDHKKAVAEMLAQSWGALDMVFSRAMCDVRIMERACRTMRLGIKGAGSEGAAMLPALLTELAARFRATRHSAFLYILSELIKLFGNEPGCGPGLSSVLAALVVDACTGLKSLAQLQQDPELVDDVFLLGCRAMSYSPELMVGNATALTALMDTALLGVLMQHREACCSVLGFMSRMLSSLRSDSQPAVRDAVQAVLLPRAETLTRLLVAGVVGVLPTARLGDVAAILCVMLRSYGNQGLQWLITAVSALPDSVVLPQDKEAFMGAAGVVVAKASQPGAVQDDRTFEGAVDDLADLCRRNPKVRVAAQQALLPPELAGAVNM